MHKIWPVRRSHVHWVKYEIINNSDFIDGMSLNSFSQSSMAVFARWSSCQLLLCICWDGEPVLIDSEYMHGTEFI